MICDKFDSLTHKEKIDFIGKLVHSVQSDGHLFIIGQAVIRQAEERGILDDVIINPEAQPMPRIVEGL